jgi:chorismate dehydratase
LEKMLDESDCALLIGDPALILPDSRFQIPNFSLLTTDHRPLTTNQLRKFDLAELWREFTGFGFVFAMWMANAERTETAKKIDFAEARDEGLRHLDEIIANYESEILLNRAEFYKYLSENIAYSIDDSMQKGLELYFQLARKNGLIEDLKPLRFI